MNYLTSAVVLALTSAAPALAQQGDAACTALRDTVIDGAQVGSARVMPAQDASPAYCEIRATARPAISIEIRLPMTGWNGGYYQAGCGGFCGILGRADAGASWVNAMRPGLERGYATGTSDSGHLGLSVTDGSWAMGDPGAERDWGWRSIGETHRIAQALIGAFYDGAAERAIFQGCSTGGRMAQVAAQRYPEMFDGIISGAPAMDYTGLVGVKMPMLIKANTDAEGNQILGPGEATLIGDAVMAQCDGVDGATDGLIADPRACNIDLTALTCTGEDSAECLSSEEMATLSEWRDGPRSADGTQLYPGGIPEGSEAFWWLWLTGNGQGGGQLVNAFAGDFGRYMAYPVDPGAEWNPLDFDPETDPARMAALAEVYNGDNPDLSAFRDAGGKMIVWHGWADSIVTPYKTVDWYDKAAEQAGGEAALKDTVALFMLPGLDHCGILPGPGGINADALDPMTPLEAWLDGGDAPMSIMAE